MRGALDKAGRVVIPKRLRDEIGLQPGEVEISVSGSGLHIEPRAQDGLEERDGVLIVPDLSLELDDEAVRALRDAERK